MFLQTEWKIRAVAQFLLEPLLKVKMSSDYCVIIFLYYSETSISVYLKNEQNISPKLDFTICL